MYCPNCRMDYPSGFCRCPSCMGWLRATKQVDKPAWLDEESHQVWPSIQSLPGREETAVLPPSPVPANRQKMLMEVLNTPRRPSNLRRRAPWVVLALVGLTLSALGFAWHVSWRNGQFRDPRELLASAPKTDIEGLADQDLRLAQEAWEKKDWARARQYARAAHELLSPQGRASSRDAQAQKMESQATRLYADQLLALGEASGRQKHWDEALEYARQAVGLYSLMPGSAALQARAVALEGRIQVQRHELVAARSCFTKAHQLDPLGNYLRWIATIPEPEPVATVARPEPPPEASEPVAPSLGDSPAYPTGHRVAVRPHAAPAPLPTAPVAPRRNPVTPRFVPTTPKRRDRKWDLHADELPSYNDGK